MTQEQRLKVEGMDLLLKEFNKYPDNKMFSVKEIITVSNEIYKKILEEDEKE